MSSLASQITDELLVIEAQGGCVRSFEQLVARWQPRAWRHARLLSDDDASAWDSVQETWSAVMKSLRRLEDPADFGPWVMRIVSNKCADAVRARTRRRALNERAADRLSRVTPPPPESDDEESERIRAAVAALAEPLRSVVSLHYGCGLSMEQIGRVLAIPAGTVKSRLSEARSRLRASIERNEHERV